MDNIFDKSDGPLNRKSIIGASGKIYTGKNGQSMYVKWLRSQNPGATFIEVDLSSEYQNMNLPETIRYTQMNKELTPEILDEAAEELSDCTGVILTRDQLLTLIDKDPSLCFRMILNGVHDTEVRGDLAGCLSAFLVGRLWPTYGEDINIESFNTLLREAALGNGFKIAESE